MMDGRIGAIRDALDSEGMYIPLKMFNCFCYDL